MKRILCIVLFALCVQTTFAQQPAGVPVQGVVTNRNNGDVVWGANVELRREGNASPLYGAVTGQDGKFAFPGVPAG